MEDLKLIEKTTMAIINVLDNSELSALIQVGIIEGVKNDIFDRLEKTNN